jgi:hypothetical protein
MNTLFIIYTFVALVCLFQIIILTCEATRQKRQIEKLQSKCEYLSKQVESLIKIADKSSEIDHLVKDRLDNVKDRFDNISDTLDLYKRLVDSLNNEQAKLNFRVQQLEMLNSNGATLTDVKGGCPYTSNGLCSNPFHDCIGCPNHGTSGVITTTSQQLPPEAIHFTKEE